MFSRTKPNLAVYSHIVLPTATEQDLIPPARKTYSGPLEVGEDLMVIEVGENVEIRRPARTSPWCSVWVVRSITNYWTRGSLILNDAPP